jgi:hypothetical protein
MFASLLAIPLFGVSRFMLRNKQLHMFCPTIFLQATSVLVVGEAVLIPHPYTQLILPFPRHALPANLPDLPDVSAAAGLYPLAAVIWSVAFLLE